jgi:hypothetical protein
MKGVFLLPLTARINTQECFVAKDQAILGEHINCQRCQRTPSGGATGGMTMKTARCRPQLQVARRESRSPGL